MDFAQALRDSETEFKTRVLEGLGFEVAGAGGVFQEDGPGNDAWQRARANAKPGVGL